MAKSIRSKSKRKNRNALRQQISIPAIKIRQASISKKLTDGLAASHGSTLQQLKKTLASNSMTVEEDEVEAEEENEDQNDEDIHPDEVKASEVRELPPALNKNSKIKVLLGASHKRRGSKPRNNPTKQLSWFK
jgi:hypothetical protein